jgi:hypothetical protein
MERESARLHTLLEHERVIVMVLEDGLNDRIYDHPLSIRLRLPQRWRSVEIRQGEEHRPHTVVQPHVVHFDALPDGSEIIIRRLDTPGQEPAGS